MLRKFKISCIIVFAYATDPVAAALPDAAINSKNNCWVDAGKRYRVDPWLLYAIAEKESNFDPLAGNQNRDNSRDVGIMQINSFWFDKLEKYGLSEQSLLDPCTNINVGAWVLAQCIQIFGNNWRAVGAYNAGTGNDPKREKLRQNYAADVYKRYVRLTGGGL